MGVRMLSGYQKIRPSPLTVSRHTVPQHIRDCSLRVFGEGVRVSERNTRMPESP